MLILAMYALALMQTPKMHKHKNFHRHDEEHRETEHGPGNYSRWELSQPHFVCTEMGMGVPSPSD